MINFQDIQNAQGRVVAVDPAADVSKIRLEHNWEGQICKPRLINESGTTVGIHEIVLFSIPHSLPGETDYYGEGFTMLSQTSGTLANPVDIGSFTDRNHYKLPQPDDAITAYGMVTLSPPKSDHIMLAFATCHRFVGKFHIRENTIEVVIDTEGFAIAKDEAWELEWFAFDKDSNRGAMLSRLGDTLISNHPLTNMPQTPPTGWCSWYCFRSHVTARNILDNLDYIAANLPNLQYIQIDDGYQPAMGDWLETGAAFGGGVQDVLAEIRRRGFEPAIWVAPFVAQESSRLFREHPEYFIKDSEGNPLRSDRVTFGGWRNPPWYAIDGTHPGAQSYIRHVFKTMHEEWGCNYFKLDACFWGAMHGGVFHNPNATRVEAYRAGLQAALENAGYTFLLGCNHPLWPSVGLVQGSRSSGDIVRNWDTFTQTARENLLRNWQNGKLWWNDPDCIVLTGKLPDNEFQFHATAIYATGGMLLSGDDLPTILPERLEMLKKLVPPTGVAAEFEDTSLTIGWVNLPDRRMLCFFNWTDESQTVNVRLPERCSITDYWTGESLGSYDKTFEAKDMPARSAMLLACKPT